MKFFQRKSRRCSLVLLGLLVSTAPALAQDKPNTLVIMTDEVGIWNISAYHRGMMGERTPNIDRIANEGALFTDYYARQSCTAGRAAFILGQTPFRTGLLNVGMPAAKQGPQDSDPRSPSCSSLWATAPRRLTEGGAT
jgi:arylsulfatase A-like enzyme